MPRRRSPEKQAEFERDRAFALSLARVLDEVIEREGPLLTGSAGPDGSLVLKETPVPRMELAGIVAGVQDARELREAIQELLELSRDFTPKLVEVVNQHFAAAGMATLSEMQGRVWKTIPKVLKRGRIRTEEEYYLLIERLNDTADTTLSDEERERLSAMIAEFEERSVQRRGHRA